MNLYEIKEKVVNSRRLVYSTLQLSKLISTKPAITNVYINRLIKKGLAKKIFGRVVFTTDDYILGTQLIEPAYISLSSALYFHHIITQIPTTTTCVTTINNKYLKSVEIKYHKITSKLFFGFKKYSLESSYAYIATPEKAVLDGIYYNLYTKDMIKEYKSKLNWKLVNNYCKLYPKKVKKVISDVN